MYRIIFKDIALKNLKKLPKPDQERILINIKKLAKNPDNKSNIRKLVNNDVAYRLRVGNYRVLFERYDDRIIVEIIDILHRKDSYRRK